jgi:Na+-driven multidrug efflux pump
VTLQPPRLVSIALPLFAELGLGIAVGVVGTLLAARLSDTTGAAFALANQVAAMLFILFRIVGAGIGVVARHAGRQQLGRRLHGADGGGRRGAVDDVA